MEFRPESRDLKSELHGCYLDRIRLIQLHSMGRSCWPVSVPALRRTFVTQTKQKPNRIPIEDEGLEFELSYPLGVAINGAKFSPGKYKIGEKIYTVDGVMKIDRSLMNTLMSIDSQAMQQERNLKQNKRTKLVVTELDGIIQSTQTN